MASAPLFGIGMRDALKSLIISVLSAFILSVYGIINAGGWPTHADWIVAAKAAAAAFMSTIIKQFLTTSDGRFLGKEEPPQTPITPKGPSTEILKETPKERPTGKP